MKKIHWFLLINLIITLVLIYTFTRPVSDNQKTEDAEYLTEDFSKKFNNDLPQNNSNQVAKAPLQKNIKELSNGCFIYGPLSSEQKASLDEVLVQNNLSKKNITIEKSKLYEVYWNLGKDKLIAIDLFEKQKNDGALQDERFKLKQDFQGNWTVPIAIVADDIELAKQMSVDLRKSTKTIGGRWQYRNRGDGYYYQIKDFNNISKSSVSVINSNFKDIRSECNHI